MLKFLEKAITIIIDVVDPEKIILFGSHATGTYDKNSDYDLLILKQGVQKRRELAMKIYKSLYGCGEAIDIIVDTPERYKNLKNNKFLIYNQIANTGKVIYEK